jgi:aryl-alcohol dehydrogenase-like predicted oxidoreductase
VLWNDRKEKYNCIKAKSIIAECEASLKRLGVEIIDLYQMHWSLPNEDIEEGYEAMAKCVRAGKVRYLGVSNYAVEDLKRIINIHPLTSLQPPYSMFRRDAEKELLGFCSEHNIGVIVYGPMQKGFFTGKFTPEKIAALPSDDVRHKDPEFQTSRLEANFKFVEELKPIARRNGITLAQLAIAWTLRRPEVTAAIVGARRAGQIKETAPAADITLSAEDIDEIEKLLNKRSKELK